jgi:hypothetical protein
MAWFHLIFGVVVFAVFTQTGALMRADFPDKEAIAPEFRILMRSRHIYILFSALTHLGLGTYVRLNTTLLQRVIQIAGSAMLAVSSLLLIWAFATETYGLQHFSDISRFGIYASLAGVVLHLIGGFRWKHDPEAGN